MKFALTVVSFIFSTSVYAQFVVASGTKLTTTAGVPLVFNHDFSSSSPDADFSNCNFILSGINQNFSVTNANPIRISGLEINGGGNKNLTGIWEIGASLILNDGFVVPQTVSPITSFIVFSVADGSLGNQTLGSPASFVKGPFYSRGKDLRVFPVGNSSGWHPSGLFSNANIDAGMEVIDADPLLDLSNSPDIKSILTTHYWQLDIPSGGTAFPGALVLLSTNGADLITTQPGDNIIVAADAIQNMAENLGASSTDNGIVTSGASSKATHRIFTLGKSDKITVLVHNVITPSVADGANDYLVIENIEFFPQNTVTLLDRWGVKVKEWKNFTNFDPTGNPSDFDFTKLSTGNYICVVEYKGDLSSGKVSQMITIINQ